MKIAITNPKVWNKLQERSTPMATKIRVYEKLGGAYRMTKEDNNTQVFNSLLELLKFKKNEESNPGPEDQQNNPSADVKHLDQPDPYRKGLAKIGEGKTKKK